MHVGSGISEEGQGAAAAITEQQQPHGYVRTPSRDSSGAQAAPSSPVSQQRLPRPSHRAAGEAAFSAASRPKASQLLAASVPALAGPMGQQPPWFQPPIGAPVRSSTVHEATAFERVLTEATAGLRTAAGLSSARSGAHLLFASLRDAC